MKTKLVALMGLAFAAAFSSADIFDVTFDVSGVQSWDAEGSPNNFTGVADMGAILSGYSNFNVIGIGWDINITTVGFSWLSESVVSFGDSASKFVYLTPGVGDDFSGTNVAYSSGGVVDLVGLSLDFALQGDNELHLEWFEGFDDVPNAMDASWGPNSFLTVRVDAQPVPEPATMAVLGLGVAALARRRRK